MTFFQSRTEPMSQYTRKKTPALILSVLILTLMLLLTACGSGTSSTVSSTPTAIPSPTIDSTLTKQGDMELQAFQQWIALLKQYNGDITPYQQQYTGDQQALHTAQTDTAYKTALAKLQGHVEAIKIPAMKTEATTLLQQLQQQVTAWGKTHTYHDSYNNVTYPLGYEYGPNGVGGWAVQELGQSQTLADYQQTIEDLNVYLTNFQAMMANTSDKTPYNQVHQTDLQLIQHYGYMNKKVVVVSLEEQALRVYDNGKLVNAFLVTTGRPEKPSPPGTWWVEVKKSPTVFKAGVPQFLPDGSQNHEWYPDTPINYAMQYHSSGYFLHDSWWRNDYGPTTNYPHADSSGDPFSAQGSHGCVNMSKDNAAWLYSFVSLNTPVIVY